MHDLHVGPERVVSISYTVRTAAQAICDVRDIPVACALTGLGIGDRARGELSSARTFGEPDSGLTFSDELDNVPPELRVLGAEFEAENEGGGRRTFRVAPMDIGKLTVDGNHPLAGKFLHDEMTVSEIRPVCVDENAGAQPILDGTRLQHGAPTVNAIVCNVDAD